MTLKGFSRSGWLAVACAAPMAVLPGLALAGDGQPQPWQMNFQHSVTPIADDIHWFHNLLLILITAIVIFVLALLVWVVVRYNAKSNPTPSRTSHHTLLEVAWTIVPVLILLVIAIPSFRLLYAQYDFPKADLTIKATGYQWYWTYAYPDHGGFNIESRMIAEEDLKPGQPRLLAVDNEIVVPVNKVAHILLTSDPDGVIHNWTVPSFGVKMDAVPGRVTRVWFQPRETGVYYGQCSELCGENHAFMPIQVRVVSEAEFATWIEEAKKKYASDEAPAPAGSTAVKFAATERQ
jgi:cytochrome c oxidase subunit 2